MRKLPQVLVAVKVEDREDVEEAEEVREAVRAAEEALGDRGRVLVRASGTEPVVRVMVEAEDEEDALRHAEAIAASVRRARG